MLASDVTPGSRHEATGETIALIHTPIPRKVRRTHKELHEEVFGTGAPVKEFVEQVTSQPFGGYHARSRVRSGTVSTHFASRPLPPVPPLPSLNRASPPVSSPNVETREVTHPEVARDPSTRPISFHVHVALDSRLSPTGDEGSMTRSNSLSSSPRRDHGRPRQGSRLRDSIVLEKARLIEQAHTLCKITILQ